MSKRGEKIKSRRGKRIRAVLLLLLTALIWIGLWLTHLYRSEPAGWQQASEMVDQLSEQQRDQIAQDLVNRLATQLTFSDQYDELGRPLPNPSSQRTIHISSDQINIWLSQLMKRWLANLKIQWPPQLGRACFWTDGGRIVLGAFVKDERVEHVVSVALRVAIDADARDAVLHLDGAWIGRLRVPLSMSVDLLCEQLIADGQPEAAQTVRELADGYHFPPVLESGGEVFRCTAIRAVPDGLEIDLSRE